MSNDEEGSFKQLVNDKESDSQQELYIFELDRVAKEQCRQREQQKIGDYSVIVEPIDQKLSGVRETAFRKIGLNPNGTNSPRMSFIELIFSVGRLQDRIEILENKLKDVTNNE